MMKYEDRPMRRLTVTIPEELVAGLEDVAAIGNKSVSDVLREVVSDFLFSGHWSGIGGVAATAILARKTNEEVLDAVLERYPGAATTLRAVSWYRSKLRKELGEEKVPTDAEVKRERERSTSGGRRKRAARA